MAIPVSQMNIYKYGITPVILRANGWDEPIQIDPSKISNISIANNYDKAITYQISLSAIVPYENYYKILASTQSLTAEFTISYANVGTTTETSDDYTNPVACDTKWVSLSLKAIDQGYLYTKDVVKKQSEILDDSHKEMNLDINLLLCNAKSIAKYRKNRSFIINGSLNDTIYEFFNSRDFDNVLMTPCDDTEMADYIVPFGDLGQNLKDLNKYKGIYNYPYLFYMGMDRNYLIDKGFLGRTLESNELSSVNIYIESYDKSRNIANGCYRDDKNGLYVLGAYDVMIDNIDSMIDYAAGGTIISAVSGEKESHTDKIGDYDVEKSILVYNTKSRNQAIYDINTARRIIGVTFNNIDVSIITPNKLYTVIANQTLYDKNYEISGRYRCASSMISLKNNGKNTFISSVNLSLSKLPN